MVYGCSGGGRRASLERCDPDLQKRQKKSCQPEFCSDVLEVRRALEELAVEIACEKMTAQQIEELKAAAKEFEVTLKSKDVTKYAEADVKFHDVIYMATDNQRLIQLLNNLREQMYRFRVEYLKKDESHVKLLEEHDQIIENIEKRNKEEAAKIVCRHIENQVESVLHTIRSKKE